jgi:hypothetical protein
MCSNPIQLLFLSVFTYLFVFLPCSSLLVFILTSFLFDTTARFEGSPLYCILSDNGRTP